VLAAVRMASAGMSTVTGPMVNKAMKLRRVT
jgi:hypothetical protein